MSRSNEAAQGAESEGNTYETKCHMDRTVGGEGQIGDNRLHPHPFPVWRLKDGHTPQLKKEEGVISNLQKVSGHIGNLVQW